MQPPSTMSLEARLVAWRALWIRLLTPLSDNDREPDDTPAEEPGDDAA